MSSLIKENDITLSNQGSEWHGNAVHITNEDGTPRAITTEDATPCLFPLVESVASNHVLENGDIVTGDKSKTLFADVRDRFTNESYSEIKQNILEQMPPNPEKDEKAPIREGYLELATMGAGYQRIENSSIWEGLANAFNAEGVPFEVTTVGTLNNLRQFYLSICLPDNHDYTFGDDKFQANLNMITSHDGSLACLAYDSMIRIVCSNTLRWSMNASHAAEFKIKHTKNAAVQFDRLHEFLTAIFAGRDEFANLVKDLQDREVNRNDFRNFAKGYLAKTNKVKKGMELSTRSQNAVFELETLFCKGQGNKGETAYDVMNAGTEYWTSGQGTGVNPDTKPHVRWAKSSFGAAAEHKEQWTAAVRDQFANLVEIGKGFALDKV